MMKWKRMLSALMAAGLLASAMPMEALAATKYVTSISLKVHAELEAGDSLDKNDDISYEKQDSGTYVYTTASRYHVVNAEWANDKDISTSPRCMCGWSSTETTTTMNINSAAATAPAT